MLPPSFPPSPLLVDACNNVDMSEELGEEVKLNSLWDGIIYFAVPKKKISFSRKRQKHDKFIPDKVNWHFCKKCGEPKLPHRICTKFKDICALTTSKWQEMKNGGKQEL
jgi:ribosomal protein L32